jgi:hypothetical protein
MSIYYTPSNNENAKQLFEKRTIYNVTARTTNTGYKNLVDFNFAEKFLYGRVDPYYVPIELSSTVFSLKSFKGSPDTFQAVNYVVDAFNDVVLEFQRCAATGQIDASDPFLSNPIVYKAYVPPKKQYDEYLKTYFNAIAGEFKANKIRVNNFDEFMIELEHKLLPALGQHPFTKSGYLKSRFCPINVSGLAIEIATLDYANDEEKIKQFINSPNWEFYLNVCRSYGFMVDKFVPWRIVADVNSESMVDYALKYCPGLNTTTKTPLNLGYSGAHTTFFNNFKLILYNLYNRVRVKSYSQLMSCNGKVKSHKVIPQRYTLEEFSDRYSELYFLKLYFRWRVLEEEIHLEDFESEILIDDSIELYLASGLSRALQGFERVVNKTFDFRGSLTYTKEYLEARSALETT